MGQLSGTAVCVWALIALQGFSSSHGVRTNENTVALAREAFFAYRSPVDAINATTDDVSYRSSDVVATFAGSVNLTIHNVTGFLSIVNKPTINAFVVVSAAFALGSTNAVSGLPDLIFEETFLLPRSKIPGIDDGIVLLSIVLNDINQISTSLGGGSLPVLPTPLATVSLNVSALSLAPGVAVPVQLNVSEAGGLINLSLVYEDALIPEVHSDAVTARNNSAVWDALLQRVDVTGTYANLTRVAFIDAVNTNTQVWISMNATAKQVVVAFRGTDNPSDFAISFLAANVPVLPEDAGKPTTPTTILAHEGFFRSWESVSRQVLSIVEACTGTDHAAWDVSVTGHSLGGAMATLGAFFIGNYKGGGWYKSTTMYNYGSPRVGNSNFAARYSQLLTDSWRHFNALDRVATLPPRLQSNFTDFGLDIANDYHHVFPALNMSMNGSALVLGLDTEDSYTDSAQFSLVVLQLGASFTLNQTAPVTPETDPDGDGQALGIFEFHIESQYLKSITALVVNGTNSTISAAPPSGPTNDSCSVHPSYLLVLAAVAVLVGLV